MRSPSFKRLGKVCFRRLKNRSESKENAGEKRRAERERQDAPVDTELAHPRNAFGNVRRQHARAPDREQQSDNTAGEREHDALREQLAQYAHASRAEGSANRHLSLASRRSCQQEIGDIRTRDQQNETNRAEECQQRRPNVTDNAFSQGLDLHTSAGVRVGILLFETCGDRVDLRVCAARLMCLASIVQTH